jgi:hypothetical protein
MSQFVITGCARSGTKYIQTVLNSLNIECSHEELFNLNTTEKYFPEVVRRGGTIRFWEAEDGAPVYGEASWLAAPFLSIFSQDITILHQVRDPIDVVKSLCARRVMSSNRVQEVSKYVDASDEATQRALEKAQQFTNFIFEHTNCLKYTDEIERAFRYWVVWNEQVERYAEYTYRLEELNEITLKHILTLVGHHRTDEDIRKALETTQTDINKSGWRERPKLERERIGDINWSSISGTDLLVEVRQLAQKYGYDTQV